MPTDFSLSSPTCEALVERWHLKPTEVARLNEMLRQSPEKIKNISQALSECDVLLGLIYGDRLSRDWMTLPNTNPLFNGASPLDFAIEAGQSGVEKIHRLLLGRSIG